MLNRLRQGFIISFNLRRNRAIPPICLLDKIYFSSLRELDDGSTELEKVKGPRLRVSNILQFKLPTFTNMNVLTIPENSTVDDAISHLAKHKVSSCLARDVDNGSISGFFTARDIIRYLDNYGNQPLPHSSINKKRGKAAALAMPLSAAMTPASKMVFCRPDDYVRRCREIMFQLKIRNIPVIEDGKVRGIITLKDLADSAFTVQGTGGKKGFLDNLTSRKGLPQGTTASLEGVVVPVKLKADIGAFALPHPYKHAKGVAHNRRQFGPFDLNDDMNLCEDSHFIVRVGDNSEVPETEINSEEILVRNESVYVGVADGVGSWRQYGVDPKEFSHSLIKNKEFSHSLIKNAERIVKMDSEHRAWSSSVGVGFTVALGIREQEAIHPLDVIIDAWTATLNDNVVGSSTFCVATLDDNTNTLSYSNIGDGGVLVVRRIDPLVAGSSRSYSTTSSEDSELQIVFLSQQQLQGFNLPYQLGFSNKDGQPKSFNSPSDADTGSIPVVPGDVIVIATDGLFDNVSLDDIVDEIKKWEDKYYTEGLDIQSADSAGDNSATILAENLVRRARDFSIDTNIDSPFALLAKENDILWGGGMPDDTTVVIMRVHLPRVG